MLKRNEKDVILDSYPPIDWHRYYELLAFDRRRSRRNCCQTYGRLAELSATLSFLWTAPYRSTFQLQTESKTQVILPTLYIYKSFELVHIYSMLPILLPLGGSRATRSTTSISASVSVFQCLCGHLGKRCRPLGRYRWTPSMRPKLWCIPPAAVATTAVCRSWIILVAQHRSLGMVWDGLRDDWWCLLVGSSYRSNRWMGVKLYDWLTKDSNEIMTS